MTGALILLVLAVIAVVSYWRSLRRHPYTPCRKCGGTGRNTGSTWRRFGTCRKCGGRGRKKRYGVRFLTPRDDR